MKPRFQIALATLALSSFALGTDLPAQLPAPDGKAGATDKPVQVYILAGQSNMVGMGEVSGAKNMFAGIYLSSDPAAPLGPLTIFKVGTYNIAPLKLFTPDGTPTGKQPAEGLLEVPEKGVYEADAGRAPGLVLTIDGTEVFRTGADGQPVKSTVTLEPGKRYPFTLTGFTGDPPRFWMEKTDLLGNGDLESVVKREGMFPWLLNDEGEWSVRQDVWFQEARVAKDGKGSLLTATSNGGRTIGPELGFGHVMGTFHDQQVLLIKTAMGNRALGFDFRPPSSGRTDPDNKWESLEYQLMVEGVRKTLENIDQVVPGYDGQGYEMAGFAWFQGHKDSFSEELIDEYEKNLANLIRDVRKEFKAPEMPVVVGSNGFGGANMAEKFLRIHAAQMAVADPDKYPEFAGTVSSVDTRPFWREVAESPKGEDYHYNRNAETYLRIGDALGRAMVRLKGGTATPLPQGPRPEPAPPTPDTEPTATEVAAGQEALRSIILDGIIPAYAANPRHSKLLAAELAGERPQRANQMLRGAIYGLVNCYRAAGIDDYEWKTFGKDLRDVEWDYFSFDPAEKPAKEEGPRYRKVAYPDGMENWTAPTFDAGAAGWKTGLPPFGQLDGKLQPLRECDRSSGCGCGEKPRTLWDRECLLVRGTFEIPPLRDGHRYRIVVGGSNHVTTGEGYAIYLDGKLLAESTSGVPNRQGGQPRGGHVYGDALDALEDGKVTIAVTSFLQTHKRGKPIPPAGHLTVWIEEQKVPQVELPTE